MHNQMISPADLTSVQRAFSKQAEHYDRDDFTNPVLSDWRQQVYSHVNEFIRPESAILELNAGTGIDAVKFVQDGHHVLATDLSPGMIKEIEQKIGRFKLNGRLESQQRSFESIDQLVGKKFDFVFSNFGGLNCCENLTKITKQLPDILNDGAIITWVIMPPVSLWELMWVFKGKAAAFRRFKKGKLAHLEGEYFKTYYHSLTTIKKNFGSDFSFLKAEGVGAFSPPPGNVTFVQNHPLLYNFLRRVDRLVNKYFPFNRWADHIIVTFQFNGHENLR